MTERQIEASINQDGGDHHSDEEAPRQQEHKHGEGCKHDHGPEGHKHREDGHEHNKNHKHAHKHDHKHNDKHDHCHDHKHGESSPAKLSVEERQKQKEEKSSKALKQLYIASCVSLLFVALQLVGGILANSIAIMSDTAHLAADLIGFLISIFSIKLALRPADKALSYGYDRAEILGTILSVVFLWGLTVWLLYEATLRIFNPPKIQEDFMMITAWAGLLFNIIQLTILGHGHSHGHDHSHGDDTHHGDHHAHGKHAHGNKNEKKNALTQPLIEGQNNQGEVVKVEKKQKNINIESAELHVLGDLLSSVGVIVASIIISLFDNATIADPICTYFFSIIVVANSLPIIRRCLHVLMEGSPDDYDVLAVEEAFKNIEGVQDVHDIHIWAISNGVHSLSAHIKSDKPLETLKLATEMCQKKFNITHTTIQVEGHDAHDHQFECENIHI